MAQAKIIIIDDDEVTCKLLHGMLSKTDYQVDTYTDPLDGVENVIMDKPQLLVLDNTLTGLSASDVMVTLSEAHIFQHTKVMMVTGAHLNESEVIAIKTLGIEKILQKPVNKEEFLSTCDQFIKEIEEEIEAKKAA
jgi:DNA-binding response OmpR family regulator